MKALIITLLTALLGCILIVMVTPLIRRSIVILKLNEATDQIAAGNYAEAESKLARYEPWAVYHPALHHQLLCKLIESEVRFGKVGSARKWADVIHLGYNQALQATCDSRRTFLHNEPDSVVNSAYAAISSSSQAWDVERGRQILLDELWKMEQYEQLVETAKKILEDDPADPTAKQKLAIVENRQRAPTVIEQPRAATPGPTRPTVPRPAVKPAVTVVKPVEATTEPAGTFEEVAGATDPQEQKIKGLQQREAELTVRIQTRRKTLTSSRPLTEAERNKESAQRRYDAMKERAMKLEEVMNNSTGQKRSSALEEMRGMKGQMMRCQQELEKSEEAAKAAQARRTSAIENDPEIKELEKDLAEVRKNLKSM